MLSPWWRILNELNIILDNIPVILSMSSAEKSPKLLRLSFCFVNTKPSIWIDWLAFDKALTCAGVIRKSFLFAKVIDSAVRKITVSG